jgi:hypothetical protein
MQINIKIASSEEQPLQQPNQQKGNQRQKKINNQQHNSFSIQKGLLPSGAIDNWPQDLKARTT